MIFKTVFSIFIFSLSTLQAAEVRLTEEAAVKLALERNESAEISQLQLEEAAKTLDKAYSGLFPTITVEATAIKNSQDPPLLAGATGSNRLFTNYTENLSVNLRQPIYTFGRLGGAIKVAKSQKEIVKNFSRLTNADLELTTRKLFNSILFYQQNLEIVNESFENVRRNQRQLNNRVSSGRVAQGDNLKMRADIASRKPIVIEAKRLLDSALLDLKNLLNMSDEDSIVPLGSLDVKTKVSLRDVRISELLQVSILENQYKIQSSLEEISKADYWPTLSFFGGYGENAYYEDFFREEHFLDQETTSFGLVLSLDFDLGGGKIYEHEINKVRTKIKRLEFEQGKRRVRTAIDNLHQQYERVLEKQKALREAVRLSTSSFQISQNSFSNGSVSQTQLNDNELLLTNNKIAYARSLLELKLVALEIQNLKLKKE